MSKIPWLLSNVLLPSPKSAYVVVVLAFNEVHSFSYNCPRLLTMMTGNLPYLPLFRTSSANRPVALALQEQLEENKSFQNILLRGVLARLQSAKKQLDADKSGNDAQKALPAKVRVASSVDNSYVLPAPVPQKQSHVLLPPSPSSSLSLSLSLSFSLSLFLSLLSLSLSLSPCLLLVFLRL